MSIFSEQRKVQGLLRLVVAAFVIAAFVLPSMAEALESGCDDHCAAQCSDCCDCLQCLPTLHMLPATTPMLVIQITPLTWIVQPVDGSFDQLPAPGIERPPRHLR